MTDESPEQIEITAQELMGMVESIDLAHSPLFPGLEGGIIKQLHKAFLDNPEGKSNQPEGAVSFDFVEWPLDYNVLHKARYQNTHHAACLAAKIQATTGLGHKSEQVAEKLNPLTESGWHEVLTAVGDDLETYGIGYIEVTRDGTGDIAGLHYQNARYVKVVREKDGEGGYTGEYHYAVGEFGQNLFSTVLIGGNSRRFARFQEHERVFGILENQEGSRQKTITEVSELIPFRLPNTLSKYYSVPEYLPAMALIEIVQTAQQYSYDYFQNWGSIATLLAFVGSKIDPKVWSKIKSSFQTTIKSGGAHKSMLVNLVNSELKIEKVDMANSPFSDKSLEFERTLAMDICSAHRTPTQIANVQASSRFTFQSSGSGRESVDMWQALVIGPRQMVVQQVLENTLGTEITIDPITKQKQGVSGVSETMEVTTESGWTLKKLRDEMEFDMTAQLGGPQQAVNGPNDVVRRNDATADSGE